MPSPIIRYPLDMTGINPDNFVSGEIKTLAVRPIRAAVPSYGPFFNDDTLVVFDHTTGVQLVKNTDYKVSGLLQEATFKTGKEICEVILITNTNVSNQIRINYQTLGGLYQSNSTNLKNLWDTILQDSRPVDWESVFDKPYEFPPSLHNHLLSDLYGFEPLVAAIERLRTALILGDVPAFELVLEQVRQLRQEFIDLDLSGKQDTLVSGDNIKSINGQSILGAGDLILQTTDNGDKQDKLISSFNIKTINGLSILGPGNINVGGSGGGEVTYGNDIKSFIQKTYEKQSNSENLEFTWTKPEGCVAIEIYAIGPGIIYGGAGSLAGKSPSLGIKILNTPPDILEINIGRRINYIVGSVNESLVITNGVNTYTLSDTASGFDFNSNGLSAGSTDGFHSLEYVFDRKIPIGKIQSSISTMFTDINNIGYNITYGIVHIVEWYEYGTPELKTINGESIIGTGNLEINTDAPIADTVNGIYPIGCMVGGNVSTSYENSLQINGSCSVDATFEMYPSGLAPSPLPGTWKLRMMAVRTVTPPGGEGGSETYTYSSIAQRVA